MSTQRETTVVECEYPGCTEIGKVWEFHHGDYCSNDCEDRHSGRKALAPIKFGHTRCFTCFTQLKEIEPPKPDHAFDEDGMGWTWDPENEWWTLEKYTQDVSRQAAIGFQHKTPDAGFGEKEFRHAISTGTICDKCGNTDHTAHIPFLVDQQTAAGHVVNLLEDVEFSIEEFHREYVEVEDLELALGRAIE